MNTKEAIQEILDKDDDLFQHIIVKFDTIIRQVLVTSEWKYTGRALFMFYLKSSLLKNAIFTLCENDDNYSSQIVYRSYIEHFLRHRYILYRFIETKTDECGIDYYKYCIFEEGTKFLWAVEKSNQIYRETNEPVNLHADLEDALRSPDYCKLTRKEIEAKAKQFEYKNILRYFRRKHGSSKIIDTPLFRWAVADYSELSSFVHGGPWAESDLMQDSINEAFKKNLFLLCKKTFNLHCVITESTFFGARIMDNTLPDLSKIIRSYLI